MAYKRLQDRLACCEYGITPNEVLSGKLHYLVSKGLQALFICNDGSGRSRTVAENLTVKYKIPTARLSGGFLQISSQEMDEFRWYLFPHLQDVSYLGLVLTPLEILRYCSHINQLKILRYSSPQSAIESIRKMHDHQ